MFHWLISLGLAVIFSSNARPNTSFYIVNGRVGIIQELSMNWKIVSRETPRSSIANWGWLIYSGTLLDCVIYKTNSRWFNFVLQIISLKSSKSRGRFSYSICKLNVWLSDAFYIKICSVFKTTIPQVTDKVRSSLPVMSLNIMYCWSNPALPIRPIAPSWSTAFFECHPVVIISVVPFN